MNFVCGQNGAGKSSILEAVYLLTNGRSFRGGYRQALTREGDSGFLIKALLEDGGEGNSELQFLREGSKQRLIFNNNTVKSRSSLIKQLPLLIFSQETLTDLIDTSQARRNILDWCLFHVEPHYHSELAKYKTTLDQYSAALKSPALDEVQWMSFLADVGSRLSATRTSMATRVAERVRSLLRSFDNLPKISVDYRPGWEQSKGLLDELKARRADHVRLGYCTVGPHRSDLRFRSDRGDSSNWASRGQIKAYYYLLFVSVLSLVAEDTGRAPIVLVDDLWAEFDDGLAQLMVDVTVALGGQSIFTGTVIPDNLIKRFDVALFHVKQGVLV